MRSRGCANDEIERSGKAGAGEVFGGAKIEDHNWRRRVKVCLASVVGRFRRVGSIERGFKLFGVEKLCVCFGWSEFPISN